MTTAYITIDTEYSSGLVKGLGADDRIENFARSIACVTPDGPAGITHKLKLFGQHGIRAVFFVDPMPALIWGTAAIEDIVGPIIEAGQDVQLHCHTEWLQFADPSHPLRQALDGQLGSNLNDFSFEQQITLLEYARDTLVAAGAPAPVAFRAGNYGANNDTLRALATLGLTYDSSHCPALIGQSACGIELGPDDRAPMLYHGVIEMPVGSIGTLRGSLRHAQITALSLDEMVSGIEHARDTDQTSFVLVTHSFELINRSTMAVNRVVRSRFEGLCQALSSMPGVATGNFSDNPPLWNGNPAVKPAEPLPASPFRTGRRLAEQIVSNTLYGAL